MYVFAFAYSLPEFVLYIMRNWEGVASILFLSKEETINLNLTAFWTGALLFSFVALIAPHTHTHTLKYSHNLAGCSWFIDITVCSARCCQTFLLLSKFVNFYPFVDFSLLLSPSRLISLYIYAYQGNA